jgi:hypothetical protein
MSSNLVILVYGSAFLAALALLVFFSVRAWYWHVLSIAAAVGLGLMPPPVWAQGKPEMDLLAGWGFVFLGTWGLGGLLAHVARSPRHRHA